VSWEVIPVIESSEGALASLNSCMVGEKLSAAFPLKAPGQAISVDAKSIDRIIIESDQVIEYTMLNKQSVNAEKITVSDGNANRTYFVIIYYDYNMIELKPTGTSPTYDIGPTDTPTVTLANFYTEQYKINPGIIYR